MQLLYAWLLTVVGSLVTQKAIEGLSKFFTPNTTRKLTHILMGLVFVLHWPLFPDDPLSKYAAGSIPLLLSVNIGLVGSRLVKDDKMVQSLSRSGNPKDLLAGPLTYGLAMVVSTVIYWKHSPIGVTALVILCVGDGLAGLLGLKYGEAKLPWNKKKTWVGLSVFVLASALVSVMYLYYFVSYGWLSITVLISHFYPLVLSVVLSGIAESLVSNEWDNLIIFVVALLTQHLSAFSI